MSKSKYHVSYGSFAIWSDSKTGLIRALKNLLMKDWTFLNPQDSSSMRKALIKCLDKARKM